jgi:hypothetical protein
LHAFKGVTGNLGVRDLPALANDIETGIKAGGPVSQALLETFAATVGDLKADLRRIESQTSSDAQTPTAALDTPLVLALLQRLVEELDIAEVNDDTIAQLRAQLGAERFAPIETELDSFELEQAAAVARALMAELASAESSPTAAASLPLLRQLVGALEASELDDDALAGLRGVLEADSYLKLEAAVESFEFSTAIGIARALITECESTHD